MLHKDNVQELGSCRESQCWPVPVAFLEHTSSPLPPTKAYHCASSAGILASNSKKAGEIKE